ncbi:MAG: ribonuclease Z [Dorea sp.]|nr:ribonuclease Z [Dorea sp.]
MILIAVVDDRNGMMFNKRRQSKDSVLQERILMMAENGRLWMNTYTYRQFSECGYKEICVDEDFLLKAAAGEYCFVENLPVSAYEKEIEKIVLFRWNRKYPSDFLFDIELSGGGWKLSETEEFSGSSHEKITGEVYVRE